MGIRAEYIGNVIEGLPPFAVPIDPSKLPPLPKSPIPPFIAPIDPSKLPGIGPGEPTAPGLALLAAVDENTALPSPWTFLLFGGVIASVAYGVHRFAPGKGRGRGRRR